MRSLPSGPPAAARSVQWLLWLLTAVSAAALLTVAAVAWQAATRQRRDGEGALRQLAADAAQRTLTASMPGLFFGLPFDSCSVVHQSWFTVAGQPGDWVFGPWPQPENEFSKACDEVQALLSAGKKEEARTLLNSAQSRLARLDPIYSGQVYSTSELRNATEVRAILTTSGIPLGPLVLRLRMELAANETERRAAASDLLVSLTGGFSPLHSILVEEAAAVFGSESANAEKAAVTRARDAVARNERLRQFVRAHRTEIVAGQRWIAGEWHFLPAPGRSINGERLLVRSKSDLNRFAREAGLSGQAGPGLPDDWVLHASMDGAGLGDVTPPPEAVMASAASGPLKVEVVARSPATAFAALDQQFTRQRWLIGGATGFMALAGAGFLLVLARQRRLNAMMANFVAAVSHELRAPVGSMGLLAERLSDGRAGSNGEQAHYHRLLRDECRRLSATIGNVLTFSRRQRGLTAFESELSDLTALMRDAVDLMRPQAEERGLILSTGFPDKPLERELDPVIIRQAVLNLLDNALKFSPPGGTVNVRLREHDGCAVITVRDEGPGIPPAERTRIFKPFYRTGSELRRETPGIGIGLAIVHAAAEAHGGSVTAGAAPGRGAEFTLRLGTVSPS